MAFPRARIDSTVDDGRIEVPTTTSRLRPGTADGGLSVAQTAAIHAVAAHFWDSTQPALVVLPI